MFTSKYIITQSTGSTFLDFDLDLEDISFRGQSILFSGSNQVDGMFLRPGMSADISNTKGSSDIIRVEGTLLDYVKYAYLDTSGLVQITKPDDSGTTQTISLTGAITASDIIVFDDYQTTVKAISSAMFLGSQSETISFAGNVREYFSNISVDANGYLDIYRLQENAIEWIKVNPNSSKTLQFADGSVSVKALFAAFIINQDPLSLDITQSSQGNDVDMMIAQASSPINSTNQSAQIKAISFDSSGENFAGFGQNITLSISGGNGIDQVYIKAGSDIDATNLKGGKDNIYFLGEWSDYTKSISVSGNITFSRTIDIDGEQVTEKVQVSNGSVVATQDFLYFKDGKVNTKDVFNSLKTSLDVALVDINNVDTSQTTPVADAIPPVLTITSDVSSLISGEQANITFSFSESVADSFTLSDVNFEGGSLSNFSSNSDNTSFSAVFTPKDNFLGSATLSIAAEAFSDEAGNTGEAVQFNAISVDTQSPILTTALSELGEGMLDVRSNIVINVDKAVSGVSGKFITLTDNTAIGYQGETNTNNFSIDVTSELVTIDNEKGLIIIDVDPNFDLDLSSSYTLSVDTGAFVSVDSQKGSSPFSPVTFETVSPISGQDNVLEALSENIQATNYVFDNKTGLLTRTSTWIDLEGIGTGGESLNTDLLDQDITLGNTISLNASNQSVVFVFSDQNPDGGDIAKDSGIYSKTDFSVLLSGVSNDDRIYIDDPFNNVNEVNIVEYDFFNSGSGAVGNELFVGLNGGDGDPRVYVNFAQQLSSVNTDGVAISSLVAIDNLLGFELDESLVISDSVNVKLLPQTYSLPDQSLTVGQYFELDLNLYFFDLDERNNLSLSLSNNLPEGMKLEGGVISGTPTEAVALTDIEVIATDSDNQSVINTFTMNVVSPFYILGIDVINTNGTKTFANQGDPLSVTVKLNEAFTLSLGDAVPTVDVLMGDKTWKAIYSSHDSTAKTITFVANAPSGDAIQSILTALNLDGADVIGLESGVALDATIDTIIKSDFILDNTATTLVTTNFSIDENSLVIGDIETSEVASTSIISGSDSASFVLSDGTLSLVQAVNFESEPTQYTLNLEMIDIVGNISRDLITININDINDAPSSRAIDNQTLIVGDLFSIDVSEFFSDEDKDDALSFSIAGDLPIGLAFKDGVLSGTPVAVSEIQNITIVATDNAGLSSSQSFDMQVNSGLPTLTSALSQLGNSMLDVRSDVVLKVDQVVSAVSGKFITFTDNTAIGYQGETNTNNFSIDVTSELVTIDNEKGLIIIDVDPNFDLDLSSSYTLSVDTGAFINTDTQKASEAFGDITFNTVIPTSGETNLSSLGEVDVDASVANYLPNFLLTETGNDYSSLPVVAQLIGAEIAWNTMTQEEQSQYIVNHTAAQSVKMSTLDGSLVESAEWIDIEGLGRGTTSGNINSLDEDVVAENVFKIDATSGSYVFVFSDQNPDGGDVNVGAGLATNSDFSVFIDEFGADDQLYVDDAFNNSSNLNVLAYELFASGNGSDGAELYLGLSGGEGDPRLYIGLEGDIESNDDEGFADSALKSVAEQLEHDDADDFVITA